MTRAALPLGAIALGLAAAGCHRGEPGAELEPPQSPVPAAVVECPATARLEAQAVARERVARGQMQRSVFDPSDGVRAVRGLLEAGRCLALAGLLEEARRVEGDAARWRAEVDRRYRGHLLELGVAERRGDARRALEMVRRLRRFLRDAPGAYARRLETRERELRAQGDGRPR